jgi:ethanolamine utilization protein EutM
MQGQSLGLIETLGYTAAVEAADAACKAAVVCLLGHELAGRGLVTVKVSGDVAAVKAAVAAGAAAAGRVGRVISVHVIPRPHAQLRDLKPGPGSGRGKTTRAQAPGGLSAAGVGLVEDAGTESTNAPLPTAQAQLQTSQPAKADRPQGRKKRESATDAASPRRASGTKRKKKPKE